MGINTKNNPTLTLTPSWNLLPKSYKIAFITYEQILILFFIPILFSILGVLYIGNKALLGNIFTIHPSNHQFIGFTLLLIWALLSTINYAPSVFFRVEASRRKTPPTIMECYKKGLTIMSKVLITELVAYVIIIIGFMALIVPGIIFFRRYSLAAYFAVDNPELSIKQILKLSAAESKPYTNSIYATFGVVIAVDLFLSIVFGSLAVGNVVIELLSYSVLFVPVLRYQEIIAKKSNLSQTIKS